MSPKASSGPATTMMRPPRAGPTARATLNATEFSATALATTHHPDVKEWASASPVAANAAVGVDPRTFEPRYELLAGEPISLPYTQIHYD